METLVFLLLVYGTYGSKNNWNIGETIKQTGGKWIEEMKKTGGNWKNDMNEVARDAGKKFNAIERGIATVNMEQKDFDQFTTKIIKKEFNLNEYADHSNHIMSNDTTILANAATQAIQLSNFYKWIQNELFWKEVESVLEGKDDCLYNVEEKWQNILEWISPERRNKRIEEDKTKSNICLQTKWMLQQQTDLRRQNQEEVERMLENLRNVANMYLKTYFTFGNTKENLTENQSQYLYTIFHLVQQCIGGPFVFDEDDGQFFYNNMFKRVQMQLKADYRPFLNIENYESKPIEHLKLSLKEVERFQVLTMNEIVQGTIRNIVQKHNQAHNLYNMKRKRKTKCCSCCNKRQSEIVQYDMQPEKQNMLVHADNDLAIKI
jgi:hypothetical protein